MVQVLIIGRDAEGWKRSLETWSGLSVEAVSLPSAGIRTFEKRSPDIVIVAEPPGSTKAEPIIEAIRDRPLGQLVPLIWVAPADAGGPEVEATSKVSPNVSPAQLVEELERHLEVQLGREPGSTAGGLAGESTAATPPSGPSTGSVEVDRSAARQPGGTDEPTANRTSPPGASTAARESSRASEPAREPVEGRDYVVEPIDDTPTTEADAPSDDPTSRDTESAARDSQPNVSSEEARNTGVDATSGTFGGGSTVFPASDPADSQPSRVEATDIERKIDEVRHQDYFAILEVERTADTDDIRQAYDRMRELYHPDAVSGRLAQSYADDIREIGDALTDAFAVLADQQLRGAYLDATTRKS
jgi:DnaJ-domain-containing protein 1